MSGKIGSMAARLENLGRRLDRLGDLPRKEKRRLRKKHLAMCFDYWNRLTLYIAIALTNRRRNK